ncbi:MAG TPA: Xan family putative trans-acting RiPP leader peptide [Archangium sp.]|uniref:Xan family putative trans-acting RiPP leader peptide n=1 Tax=Archangium sp. TaxID=1872627 RepID=UPI002E346F6D|nr:Xan family putative trans-acting RiPP leader peptide [Archangium sp.]HEX5751033.1 Xan family putative trans-acting RiPP leader peptide [Archangium sp.]
MAAEETTPVALASSAESTPVQAAAPAAAPEKLDELEEINFLLEEIESKIAPLALA